MAVIIQPSFGNAAARRHWADTIDRTVPFTDPRHASALRPAELRRLLVLHPEGRCHFWGATAAQDARMDTVRQGDVVLFTGQNHVRGIAEVGVTFRNRSFADTLWQPDSVKGSWHNVYSLITFTPQRIPYQELRDALGSDERDNFMGLRIIRDERETASWNRWASRQRPRMSWRSGRPRPPPRHSPRHSTKIRYSRQSAATCQRPLSPPPPVTSHSDERRPSWYRPTSPRYQAQRSRGESAVGAV